MTYNIERITPVPGAQLIARHDETRYIEEFPCRRRSLVYVWDGGRVAHCYGMGAWLVAETVERHMASWSAQDAS